MDHTARDPAAARAVGIGRIGAVHIRERVNDQRGAVCVEDAEIAGRQRDAAGHVRHESGAIRADPHVDQIAAVVRVVGRHR